MGFVDTLLKLPHLNYLYIIGGILILAIGVAVFFLITFIKKSFSLWRYRKFLMNNIQFKQSKQIKILLNDIVILQLNKLKRKITNKGIENQQNNTDDKVETDDKDDKNDKELVKLYLSRLADTYKDIK